MKWPASPDPAEPPEDLRADAVPEKEIEGPVDDFQAEFDKLVQLDQEWRDHFTATNIPIRQSSEEEEKRQFMFDSLAAGTSVHADVDGSGAGDRFGGRTA